MKRARRRHPAQIDYTKVSDEALKNIRQHVSSESRQRYQIDRDRVAWNTKLAKVEAEMKRRGVR